MRGHFVRKINLRLHEDAFGRTGAHATLYEPHQQTLEGFQILFEALTSEAFVIHERRVNRTPV